MSVVSGLLKGATYHARLVARNGDGLSLGADVAFTIGGPIPAANAPAPLPGSDRARRRSRLGPGLRQAPGNAQDALGAGARPARAARARRDPRRRPAGRHACSSACPAPRAPWR